jgi:16S rRNA processing protein RimM
MDVLVGRAGRAHGIRGEVSVELRTDDPELRFAVGAVLRPEPSGRPRLTVQAARPHGDRLLITFAEIGDRTEAESLRGAKLFADVPADVPADTRTDDPDEFYDHQLVGLQVRTTGGSAVGTVTGVQHRPGQDLLVVEGVAGTHLIPFVAALVPEVDLVAETLLVRPPPGLLDPDLDPALGSDGDR